VPNPNQRIRNFPIAVWCLTDCSRLTQGTATTFLTMSDTGVFYDLKNFLTNNNQSIPPELVRHEASKNAPEGPGFKKKDKIQYAKK
jgi:hypothetical protein